MNPVAGSLTTTANAARENSIKGPGEGGGERSAACAPKHAYAKTNVKRENTMQRVTPQVLD